MSLNDKTIFPTMLFLCAIKVMVQKYFSSMHGWQVYSKLLLKLNFITFPPFYHSVSILSDSHWIRKQNYFLGSKFLALKWESVTSKRIRWFFEGNGYKALNGSSESLRKAEDEFWLLRESGLIDVIVPTCSIPSTVIVNLSGADFFCDFAL